MVANHSLKDYSSLLVFLSHVGCHWFQHAVLRTELLDRLYLHWHPQWVDLVREITLDATHRYVWLLLKELIPPS